MHLRNVSSSRRRGFTLIELVVVVGILVVLAGAILPKLDTFKLKANKGVAAASMSGINQLIEINRVSRDVFPDNWDSLQDSAALGTLHGQLNPQLIGGVGTTAIKLTASTPLTAGELDSLVRMGITTVFDHNTATQYPSDAVDSGPRALVAGDVLATINAADADGAAIINSFYPNTGVVPAGKQIIVFGLGEHSTMVGSTMYQAPFYPNADQLSYYSRYLVCFEVDGGGSRARLIGTLGADGDLQSDEVKEYYTTN